MPQDAVTLNALTQELNMLLKGGRIEKISQPESDELMFSVRTNDTRMLVISANPVNPRIHLTSRKKDNPYIAPPFLMLMRKHLTSSRVKSVALANSDRIVRIDFAARNELQDEVAISLFVELIGRYSNIILVGADGAVIEALKHVAPSENKRCVLPKLHYELPEQIKTSIFDARGVKEVLSGFSAAPLYDYLFRNLSGFSAPTLNEILYASGISADAVTLSKEDASRLSDSFARFADALNSTLFQPCLSFSSEKKYEDYFLTPYKHTGKSFVNTSSLNEAVDILSSEKDRTLRLKIAGEKVAATIKASLEKARRHIKAATEKLEECKLAERHKLLGELITANIYSIEKGAEKAAVQNYYDNGAELIIQLDPQLNAQQNAQRYYKKYAKLKRAESVSATMLKTNQEAEEYLLSVRQNFIMAESADEIAEIEAELRNAGYLHKDVKLTKKKVKQRESAPAKYFIAGFTVLRGKNNSQNEIITFKTAHENDIWLHSKAYHGSHVIILAEGREVPEEAIVAAAKIAAYYSEQRNLNKAQVDYCKRKSVKRHPSGNCGMVTYSNYRTLTVTPEPHESNKLL